MLEIPLGLNGLSWYLIFDKLVLCNLLFFRPEEDPLITENHSNGDIRDDTYSLLPNQRKDTVILKDVVFTLFSWKNEQPSYLTETVSSYGVLIFCKYTMVAGLQIRVRIVKLFSLFLVQNICCGYSKEPSH